MSLVRAGVSVLAPIDHTMPKPTRDFPLIFRNEIAKLDAKIAKLQQDRSKLVQAYIVVSGDESTFADGGAPIEAGSQFREAASLDSTRTTVASRRRGKSGGA